MKTCLKLRHGVGTNPNLNSNYYLGASHFKMKILTVNCGSSSLRVDICEIDNGSTRTLNWIFTAHAKNIGNDCKLSYGYLDKQQENESLVAASHQDAIEHVVAKAKSLNILSDVDKLAVGHRIVHGGSLFTEPTILDDKTISLLSTLKELSPLHQDASLSVIKKLKNILCDHTQMFASFDTTFHKNMPRYAREYAIPADFTKKHSIYRYGFHGLAHRSMTKQASRLLTKTNSPQRIITLQLGNGCSACAVKNGKSIETSMGFTPLEGLVMGTRSGNIDPFVTSYLAKHEVITQEKVLGILNTESGLLGVSQVSANMNNLLSLQNEGHEQSQLAIEMFCHRVRMYIGSYIAILGGVDAIVFGGGIGENAEEVRAKICSNLEWFGIQLCPNKNSTTSNLEINQESSKVKLYVLRPNEAEMIAEDAVEVLGLH